MGHEDRPRFFHAGPLAPGELIVLAEEETAHAAGSLRLHSGDAVTLLNGEGGEAAASIVDVQRRQLRLRIEERVEHERPPGPALWLAAAVIRGPRFDFVLEKAVEIGVDVIVPLLTRHGEVRPAGQEKPERWRRLLVAGMKQSKQFWLPRLLAPTPVEELLEANSFDGIWAAHPGLRRSDPGDPAAGAGSWLLLTGPEGGWHPLELRLLSRANATFISLGPNRLRAETASLALLIHFRSRQGSFGPATPFDFEGSGG